MASLLQNTSYKQPTSQAIAGAIKSIVKRPPITKSQKAVGVSPSARGVAGQVKQMSGYNRAPMSTGLGPVTVPYGGSTRYERFHPGVDIAAPIGTPISATTGGIVKQVVTGKRQGDKGYGNYVLVVDEQGNTHRYSHLSQSYVRVGERVNPGYRLGAAGNTGQSYSVTGGTGSHLDYRVLDAYKNYIDPSRFLKMSFNK